MNLTRRSWLSGTSALATFGGAAISSHAASPPSSTPFRYGLNTSTIRGQKLSLPAEIDLAAEVGYSGVEPWSREIDEYVQSGGSLKDLAQRIKDRGLSVYSAIGFAEWSVDDEGRRKKGLEQARREMDLVKQLGGTHIAAPPSGMTNTAGADPRALGERYRALLEIGDQIGVIPQVEVWGFSKTIGRLSEAVAVAIEADHPRSTVLADAYHLHKGGSGIEGLRLLAPSAMVGFHMNDYPATPDRSTITDAHRVYPGDGVAPLTAILKALLQCGFTGFLSLELFNRDYWSQDAKSVARTGLEKMKASVAAAQV